MERQVPLAGKRVSVFDRPRSCLTEIHQIGRVLAVVDGESGIKANLVGVFEEQLGADAVERAGKSTTISLT